jgi:hypothetical protein
MKGQPARTDRVELRRDRRYLVPMLDVTIAGGWFRALNWSMGGLLLDGICQDIGSRVRGTVGLTGSCEIMPFAATVVRIAPEFGSCALCFDDPRAERVEEDENAFADRLH